MRWVAHSFVPLTYVLLAFLRGGSHVSPSTASMLLIRMHNKDGNFSFCFVSNISIGLGLRVSLSLIRVSLSKDTLI